MSEPAILEYHVRRRRPWRRLAVLVVVAILATAGGWFAYARYVRPRIVRAEQLRAYQRKFDELLKFSPNLKSPVAAIVDEALLQRDPKAISRFGQIPEFWSHRDEYLQAQFMVEQLYAGGPWFNTCVQYAFQHGTNIFLGERAAPGGAKFLVALDVTVNGRAFEFHAVTINLSTPNLAEKFFTTSLPQSALAKVADYSFTEDACYIMPGMRDPTDASAFTFDVIHGERRDQVVCRLRSDGSLDFIAAPSPAGENRWRIVAK